jgi:hypothetical protein
MAWTTHRIVVEVPVEDGHDIGETAVRYAVEYLIGGDKLHRELNRARPNPAPTGRVRVKMWSKAKRWLKEEV